MMKLSKWLKTQLKDRDHVKGTLEETINHLLQLKPPVKKNTEQTKALKSSLRDLLKKDKELCKENELLNTWLNVLENERKKKDLKIIDKKNQAIFKNVRVLQYSVSNGTNSTQPQNINNAAKEEPEEPAASTIISSSDDSNDYEKINEPLALQVTQRFSLSASQQGSFTEPIFEHVERSLFRFISKHHQYVPSKTVEEFAKKCIPPRKPDFSDADLLCLLNFIIQNIHLFTNRSNQSLFNGDYELNPSVLFKSFKEVRNYNAHGITRPEGRWDDDKLRRLSTLALEVAVCFSKFYNTNMILFLKVIKYLLRAFFFLCLLINNR